VFLVRNLECLFYPNDFKVLYFIVAISPSMRDF